MYLSTRDLVVPVDAAQHHIEPVNTAGWSEVCKGLYGVLFGYLLIVGAVIGAVVLAIMTIAQLAAARPGNGAGGVFSLLVVGAIVLTLLVLAGYGLIIRSQWRCLRNAPEQCGAKWWMFATMLCIVAGPAMGMAASLAGEPEAPANAQLKARLINKAAPMTFREALAESKKAGAAAAPMKIVSSVIGLLAQVFFVLFLRSVALSFNDGFRARVAELYLLVVGVLSVGLVGLIVAPEIFLTKPLLLLLLGGGWAISAVCYLVLIVSTCACIHGNLAALRSRTP
jgi:MFS family permease